MNYELMGKQEILDTLMSRVEIDDFSSVFHEKENDGMFDHLSEADRNWIINEGCNKVKNAGTIEHDPADVKDVYLGPKQMEPHQDDKCSEIVFANGTKLTFKEAKESAELAEKLQSGVGVRLWSGDLTEEQKEIFRQNHVMSEEDAKLKDRKPIEGSWSVMDVDRDAAVKISAQDLIDLDKSLSQAPYDTKKEFFIFDDDLNMFFKGDAGTYPSYNDEIQWTRNKEEARLFKNQGHAFDVLEYMRKDFSGDLDELSVKCTVEEKPVTFGTPYLIVAMNTKEDSIYYYKHINEELDSVVVGDQKYMALKFSNYEAALFELDKIKNNLRRAPKENIPFNAEFVIWREDMFEDYLEGKKNPEKQSLSAKYQENIHKAKIAHNPNIVVTNVNTGEKRMYRLVR